LPSATGDNHRDLDLVRQVQAGSVDAWHAFIDRYANLIYSVISRYHFDRDDVQGAFVDTLEALYRGKLFTYDGTASLSTWLVHVVRSSAIDHLRKRLGRRRLPHGLKTLGPLAIRVFKLYYLEGLGLAAVQHRLAEEGSRPEYEDLLEVIEAIESGVDAAYLRRITYALYAESVGAVSARMLEFLDRTRDQVREAGLRLSPEFVLMEKEAKRTANEILAMVNELPEPERRALSLRYDRDLTARQIARRMGVPSQRGVYSLLDRAFRHLRKMLRESGLER
jgi:RNA polymerase sigma factor (sigma-70 family)